MCVLAASRRDLPEVYRDGQEDIFNGLLAHAGTNNPDASFTGATNSQSYTYASNSGEQAPTGISAGPTGYALWEQFAGVAGQFSGGNLSNRGNGNNDLTHVVSIYGDPGNSTGIDDKTVDTGTNQRPITVIMDSGSTSSLNSNSNGGASDNSFHITSLGAGSRH